MSRVISDESCCGEWDHHGRRAAFTAVFRVCSRSLEPVLQKKRLVRVDRVIVLIVEDE